MDQRNESSIVFETLEAARSGLLSRREVLRRGLALGLSTPIIMALLAACGGDDDDDDGDATNTASEGSTTTTTPSDGPSAAMVESDRSGYIDTPWPSEHADRWRTHAAIGGLPEGVESADLVATSVEVPPVPAWGYTRGDHVYVIGGSTVYLGFNTDLIEKFEPDEAPPSAFNVIEQMAVSKNATPYVAKIDPQTMTAETLEFPEGLAANYTGGLLMHENGSIYASVRAILYKINADDLTIEGSLELPLLMNDNDEPDELTIYNGIQVRANGQLVLKGCDLSGRVVGGKLMLIDPDSMEITAETDSEYVATARITLAIEDDVELLYHSSPNDSIRYIVTDDGFELDDSWTATYRPADQSGTTQASSPVYMGGSNAVAFSNNTEPFNLTMPMQMYSQSTTSNEGGSLEGQQAFDNSNPQMNFFMVAADPFITNIVVVEDQYNGLVAGWQLGDDASLTKVWDTDEYRVSAGCAIAYEQGHVYIDDRRCDDSGENCTLWVVVLDIKTGDKIAEVQVEGSQPSVSQMFVGSDAVYFLASETASQHGYVTRVAAG